MLSLLTWSPPLKLRNDWSRKDLWIWRWTHWKILLRLCRYSLCHWSGEETLTVTKREPNYLLSKWRHLATMLYFFWQKNYNCNFPFARILDKKQKNEPDVTSDTETKTTNNSKRDSRESSSEKDKVRTIKPSERDSEGHEQGRCHHPENAKDCSTANGVMVSPEEEIYDADTDIEVSVQHRVSICCLNSIIHYASKLISSSLYFDIYSATFVAYTSTFHSWAISIHL